MEGYSVAIYRDRVIEEKILRSAANLYCRTWQEPPWSEQWEVSDAAHELHSIVLAEGGILVLCLLGETVVGFTGGWPIDHCDLLERAGPKLLCELGTERPFYVAEVGVDCAFRGHGFGRRLCEAIISQANQGSEKSFVLRTDVLVEPARRLYQHFLFRDTGIPDLLHPSRTYWVR